MRLLGMCIMCHLNVKNEQKQINYKMKPKESDFILEKAVTIICSQVLP